MHSNLLNTKRHEIVKVGNSLAIIKGEDVFLISFNNHDLSG